MPGKAGSGSPNWEGPKESYTGYPAEEWDRKRMVLVDTSVWVSHLREGNSDLVTLLEAGEVVTHPFVIGELACGNLRNRSEILSLLQELPMAVQGEYDEALQFIDHHQLMGKGIGYIDIHLLLSVLLSNAALWTLDKKLDAVSGQLGVKRQC